MGDDLEGVEAAAAAAAAEAAAEEEEEGSDLDEREDAELREQLEREREQLLAELAQFREIANAPLPALTTLEALGGEEDACAGGTGDGGEEGTEEGTEEGEGEGKACGVNSVAQRVCRWLRIVFLVAWFSAGALVTHLVLPVWIVRATRINHGREADQPGSDTRLLTTMQKFYSNKGHVGLLPQLRVLVSICGGALMAVMILVATEDEFLFGRREAGSQTPHLQALNGTQAASNVYPVEIAFKDVGCMVPGRSRPILSQVNGTIPPGHITGILGPSGAGKSTFASTLLGRGERLCSPPLGEVFLNGERRALTAILDRVGYVPQSDELFGDLTVEETLRHSASWRLPWYFSERDREIVLEETLDLLDLKRIRHERIGGLVSRGISGGEKKRVSIGVELIMNPSVLVMDEPTSGLDDAAAFRLMRQLRNIADRKGVSVVIVMHVPSARVFKLLDNLVLLQHGEAAFVGPRAVVLDAFAEMGFDVARAASTDAKLAMTVPEYLLDVLAGAEPYPQDLCPYASMLEEAFGDAPGACGGKETLPERWRRLTAAAAFEVEQAGETDAGAEAEAAASAEDTCDSKEAPASAPAALGEHESRPARWRRRLARCATPGNNPRWWCVILNARSKGRTAVGDLSQYPRVPKPGLVQQALQWLLILGKLTLRKGILLESATCAIVAASAAWVRSYSKSWDARATGAFFVSVTISSTSCFSAVFNDDIGPVKRAADSGMVLGAHHNALIVMCGLRALCVCTLFSVVFHLTLALRGSDVPFFSLRRHVGMIYITSVAYVTNYSVSALLCVLVRHRFDNSCVASIAYLLWTHVFAMHTPNQRQIELDSEVLGSRSIRGPVMMMVSMSPQRYFIEAFTVWDSEPDGQLSKRMTGRLFMLNYFGYRDNNLSTCCSVLFIFHLSMVVLRWVIFGYVNSTEFHTLYDTPLFAKFFAKVHLIFSLSLGFMVVVHKERHWALVRLQERLGYSAE